MTEERKGIVKGRREGKRGLVEVVEVVEIEWASCRGRDAFCSLSLFFSSRPPTLSFYLFLSLSLSFYLSLSLSISFSLFLSLSISKDPFY